MKLYLDIDGVLLTRKQGVPDHVELFIDFVTSNYDFYWLTTHCRTGENKALNYLKKFYPDGLMKKINNIKPTNWTTQTTEAIDFPSEFIWLDDNPFETERAELIKHNNLDSLLVVDLDLKNELLEIIKEIVTLSKLISKGKKS